MKEICCNSYCVAHINFTFENKCRQFILAVVIWRWHWVRWGMIKYSTSQPCGLKCMQSDPYRTFWRGGGRHFWVLWCYTKRNDMFLTVLAKQRKTVVNLNLFSFSCREGRSEPAICYNTPLKWLRICPNAVGVDHRITVSMAVNQGISFYLGCPKSALVSLTNTIALINRAENSENDPKDIHSRCNGGLLKGWWKPREHKGWKHINYHSHLWNIFSKEDTLLCETPF